MFDRVFGLPAHPLFIHAAVVLVPLLAVAALAYAVAPFTRRHIRWPTILLAIGTPGAVFAAKQSGEDFRTSPNFQAPELQAKIATHEHFADTLFLVVLGLAVVSLALAFVVRAQLPAAQRSETESLAMPAGRATPMALQWVLIVATVALAAACSYYVYRTGDSGAKMVWAGFQS